MKKRGRALTVDEAIMRVVLRAEKQGDNAGTDLVKAMYRYKSLRELDDDDFRVAYDRMYDILLERYRL